MRIKILFLLFLISAAFGCMNRNENATTKIVIDRHTTQTDLADMVEGLKAVDINLDVEESIYNDKGLLTKISGKVDFGASGNAGFRSEKVGSIIITKKVSIKDGGFSVVVRNRWF